MNPADQRPPATNANSHWNCLRTCFSFYRQTNWRSAAAPQALRIELTPDPCGAGGCSGLLPVDLRPHLSRPFLKRHEGNVVPLGVHRAEEFRRTEQVAAVAFAVEKWATEIHIGF